MGEDDEEVRRVAADYVERWGVARAVEFFIDQATMAVAIGDEMSARTWREIAAAARELDEEGWRT